MCAWTHNNAPNLQQPPAPILRQHFRGTNRKWAGGSASRHLKATSCFPAALCQPWGCAPWLHPQNFPRAPSQQHREYRMVDMIAKLTRRPSQALRGQVGDPSIGGVSSDSDGEGGGAYVVRRLQWASLLWPCQVGSSWR